MLINCPRCGFQQPKDRYCAQCGVDIDNYRAPKASALGKLTRNPVAQMALVIGIGGAVGLSLYKQKSSEMEERVSYLKRVQVVNSAKRDAAVEEANDAVAGEMASADAPAENAPTAPAPEVVNAPSAFAAPTDATANKAAVPPTGAVAAAGAAKDAKAEGPVVRVFFAEINTKALNEIYEESRNLGLFNKFATYYAGIVPNLGQRISPSNRDIKVLFRDQKPISTQQPVQFFQGLHGNDPENEVGLRYSIELQEMDANTFRGNIELVRSWRMDQGPIQKEIYPAVFELTQGSAFFMSELLPTRSPMSNDNEFVAVSPFEILRSRQFMLGASSTILFIEFDRH